MRYYKVNNTWYTYDELHNNLGYTRSQTDPTNYKSTGDTQFNWGDDNGSGYAVPTNVYSEQSLFRENSVGWYSLNDLVEQLQVYPAQAESKYLVKDGVVSPVVTLSFEDEPRYLIKEDLSVGWITEDEYIDRGWREPLIDPQDFIICSKVSGLVVGSVQYDGIVTFPSTPSPVVKLPQ